VSDPLASTRPRLVAKPWGEERVFAEGTRYAGKLILIRKGEALSLQYHDRKEETIHVLEGVLGLFVERDGELEALLPPIEIYERWPDHFRLFAVDLLRSEPVDWRQLQVIDLDDGYR